MKFTVKLKKVTAVTAAIALLSVSALTASVSASVPYDGDNTPSLDHPEFNVYTGVPSVGTESDFFRGKESNATGYVNDVQSACGNGQQFTLRVYAHNGASETLNDNGNGVGVAHNTSVKVALPTQNQASNFALNSSISSSNAGGMNDGMTINCGGGKVVKLNYVAGSAKQYTVPGGTQALSDSIVTTGAPIGTMRPDGNVYGCWNQRVWVTLNVEVKDVPQEQPSAGVCKAVGLTVADNRTVKVNVNGDVNNAQIIGYKIDLGDGTTVNEQSTTHQYAKDGNYKVIGYVNVKFADGHTEWKTAAECAKMVTFNPKEEPKVTTTVVTPSTPASPTSLPKTGPASVLASVVGISAVAAAAHRWVTTRRYAQS